MPTADARLPGRLLAGGGPGSPDARVLRALTTPLIGQFDPHFTAIMDDVVQLGRRTFVTDSAHCFAISALPSGGLEAVLNTLLEGEGERVAIGGSPRFAQTTADLVRRTGATPVGSAESATYVVALFIDPFTGVRVDVAGLAAHVHRRGARLILEATAGLGACELRVDEWGIDVCVAGADYGVGAPSGMTLVTWSPEINSRMQQRSAPPRTSYLDLLQLQAYWSPERLNHHTAPTSLVYALREALRLVQLEGLETRWRRHAETGDALRAGLRALGLDPRGDAPYALVRVPNAADEYAAWRRLLEEFGVHVTRVAPRTWRLGLLGADACPAAVHHILSALGEILPE
jgi:alanine-glyoxylate transaminase / serine-glyoxylate transaminase / serine-pyruvate transaminase